MEVVTSLHALSRAPVAFSIELNPTDVHHLTDPLLIIIQLVGVVDHLPVAEMDADAIIPFLVSRCQIQSNPPPAQLKFLIDACLAADPTLAISKQDERHWYCTKQQDEVVIKVATYLIYLFSYNRTGQVAEWVTALEKVVLKSERCARGFCSARVEFRST